MWRIRFFSILALSWLLIPASGAAQEAPNGAPAPVAALEPQEGAPPVDSASIEPATEVVEMLHAGLLDIMRKAEELGYQGRYDRLAPVVSGTFDLDFMAEKSVGRHWKQLESPDQERWLDSFVRLTTANYAGRFKGYSGQTFETLGQEAAAHETVVVRTKLVQPDDDDIQLNYRLRETPAGWRIVDVYLNGTVSELALRRSEYASVLKRDGFETLLAQLDQKASDLAAGTVQ